MTIDELRQALEAEGIRPSAYCLGGAPTDNTYCLRRDNEQWQVEYFERGLRLDPAEFATESDAAEELLRRVLADPTTRRDWDGRIRKP